MAVTVNLYYSGVNGNARKFAQEMTTSGIVSAIRAETGNLRYEYFFPMEDEEKAAAVELTADEIKALENIADEMNLNVIRGWEKEMK